MPARVKAPTAKELRALPVSVPLYDAGRVFGLGRTATYEAYHSGEFPVPVLKVGRWLRCNRADILRALGIPVQDESAGAPHEAPERSA